MNGDREIKVVLVDPPKRGPGGHVMRWMAYYAGDEESGPRGWGDTQFEASSSLKREARQ